MSRSTLPLRIGVWVFVLIAIGGLYAWRKSRGPTVVVQSGEPASLVEGTTVVFEPQALDLSEFTFTDSQGKEFRFDELKGQVWVANFFFRECPGPCRLLNGRMAELQKATKDMPVTLLSFSIDPSNDTPEKLTEYAAQFGADPARWRFLTGKQEDVFKMAFEQFRVSAAGGGDQPLTHTEKIVPVDAQGRMVGKVSISTDAELKTLVRQLKKLTEEPGL